MALFASLLSVLVLVLAAAAEVIDVDVAVIGGGGSGAYAAVKLRENFGKRIAVIEKRNQLGGHTETWYDPETRRAFNYGVEAFTNISASTEFFAQLHVPIKASEFGQPRTLYVDLRDGKLVNYTPPNTEAIADAMAGYRHEWLKYADLMLPTGVNFPTGDGIPQDLLLTWREFARKYGLEAAGPSIWDIVAVDLNTALTIDVWKSYNPSGGAIQPASGDNYEIWQRAAEVLGSHVMYESQVVSAERSNDGVQLQVKNKAGDTTKINARRLLVTVAPETIDAEIFDLSDQELAVFTSTTGNRYYTGIVSHPSLPAAEIANVAPGSIAADYLAFPSVPFQAGFNYRGNSSAGPVHRALAVVAEDTEIEDAKSLVRSSLQNLMDAGTIPAGNSSRLEFKTFEDHGFLYRRWSAAQLRDGIVAEANALQGLRSTWYTGAFWMNNNVVMIWNTTDAILQRMLQDI
ncbi:hypothetical protein F66182_7730 [Fusarium sp. NRRL 66182]|nr:hypothetical protein F66182_7730 [Fusarium sp. NRRL 66182]